MKKLDLIYLLFFIPFFWGCEQQSETETPVACFEISNKNASVGEIISFSNCSTNASNYAWEFGDGNISSEISPTHSYENEGQYVVKLRALNKDKVHEESQVITVSGEGSTVDACFTVNYSEINEGQSVTFTNCSSNADSYAWDFGDGGSSSQTSPSHTFNTKGTYTVKLTASAGSDSDQTTKQIIVHENPDGTVTVEFLVQMRIEYLWGRFNYDYDYVDIAGNFNNWGETQMKLVETDVEGIYYAAVSGFEVGANLEYKFRINGNWETSEFAGGGPDRTFTVKETDNIVSHWYNDVDIVTVIQDAYDGVPINSYNPLFIEDFSESPSAFSEGSDTYYNSSVHDGIYEVQNLHTSSDYLFWNDYDGPDETLNYELEYRIKITDYDQNYGSGIFWGKNPEEFEYDFFMNSPDGYYKMGYFYSDWVYWVDWTSGANSAGSYNKVTIRKLANNYYVFLNENYLFEQAVDPFYGNKFGVTIGPAMTVEYDYFYIKMIDLDFGNNSKTAPINLTNKNSNPENAIGPKSGKR